MIVLIRAVLVVILLLTVAANIAKGGAAASIDAPSRLASALQGRLTGPVTADARGTGEPLVLRAPVAGCAAPLVVVVVAPALSQVAWAAGFAPSGNRLRFAYLDWSSDRPDRWALFWAKLRGRTLEAAGLGAYTDLRSMLAIAQAPGCHVAEQVPWRRFWLKASLR